MDLLLLGVSHHTAPVDLRERVDFSRRGVVEALRELAIRPAPPEAVVVTTCNRAEIYVACEDTSTTRSDLGLFMSRFHDVPESELTPHLYAHTGADVARHLFRVAAGLDSLIVGEPQIFGQVKSAFATASSERCTGSLLNKLFMSSFAVGKKVRAETGLGEGAVSVSYAAISLARKIFGNLQERRVLVVGAGDMAELTALHLQSQQVAQIVVANRTLARAEALARKVGGAAVAWSAVDDELLHADIVVTATGSQTPVISAPSIDRVMRARRNRPLFVVDIGLPRDVDPAAGELEQVFLYNIDDLRAMISENLVRRQEQTAQAEVMIGREVDDFVIWQRSRGAIPTLVALRRRFEAVREAELERLAPRLNGLSADDRARVEDVTRLLVQKLLLEPTERLKTTPDEATAAQYADALTQLFSLGEPHPSEGSNDTRSTSNDGHHSTRRPPSKNPVTS
ncbi:MAG: glutamyl-tRNA reductase [Vicinamibacterales bacterium]|jgi:glutamyl-tRNA reductase|nr:glutamyl-tRNA reductase [Vicinamibacterales bacterium]